MTALEPSDDPLTMAIGGYPVEAPDTYSEVANYAAEEGISIEEAGEQLGLMTGG